MIQSTNSSPVTPKQQIGLLSAVAIGTASMIGAGVFVVFRDAVLLAGPWFYVALLLAALLAILNAAAIYQLATQVTRPGGTYAYARIYLGDSWSFIAGFSFVAGKIASIGAIGLVVANYLVPTLAAPLAVVLIMLLTGLNILGIQRTAAAAKIISLIVLGFFVVFFVVGFTQIPVTGSANLMLDFAPAPDAPLVGVLSAASVLFFAFAGYARVATLGDEVVNPRVNIPRAIAISLTIVVMLYFAVSSILVGALGSKLLTSTVPFAEYFEKLNIHVDPLVSIIVAIAGLGSMLALLAGVSRTAAEMASDTELPKVFASKNRFGSPWLAELSVAAGASTLVLTGQLIWVIGFSSFSVLLYYSVAQVSALRQPKNERLMPKSLNVLGLVIAGCVLISVPGPAVIVSSLVLIAALGLRRSVRRT